MFKRSKHVKRGSLVSKFERRSAFQFCWSFARAHYDIPAAHTPCAARRVAYSQERITNLYDDVQNAREGTDVNTAISEDNS
jgi:hypothetical protein